MIGARLSFSGAASLPQPARATAHTSAKTACVPRICIVRSLLADEVDRNPKRLDQLAEGQHSRLARVQRCWQLRYLKPRTLQTGSFASPSRNGYAFALVGS